VRIVISPQGFKGTLSGIEAASAMAEGVHRVAPDAELLLRPVADGGHGTLDTLLEATGGEAFSAQVTGPMGRQVDARWGLLGDGATAVVEMAQASGLTLVPEAMRDPMIATTYGTGQLIKAALAAGHRRLLIGVGGSATSDGGAGVAQALGVRLLDAQGHDIPFGAAGLLQVANIDLSTLNPLTAESRFQVATDVSNPLCGPDGAAMVYGPQKGAQPEQLPLMEAALSRLADIVQQEIGVDVRDLPGAGAAGGLAAGLVAFLGAKLTWGIELVCDAIHFDDTLQGAELVLTGEGRLDGQTVSQKAPIGVARRAKAQHLPVLAVAGSLGPGYQEVLTKGIDLVEAASPEGSAPPETVAEASRLLADATEHAMRRAQAAGLVDLNR
jgi:glycerate kinase